MSLCLCNPLLEGVTPINTACIGASWIFQDLEVSAKMELVAAAARQDYKKGDVLFRQGDLADKMFMLKYGRVKLTKVNREGNEIILDIVKAGDVLGEQVFWKEFYYPCSAICLEDTYTCGFTRQGFEQLVLENPQIGLAVIRNLSMRMESLYSKNSSLVEHDMQERVYGILYNIGKTHGKPGSGCYELDFSLSHEELGFLMGVHRVSVTRTLKALKDTGLVKKEQGKLFVYHSH